MNERAYFIARADLFSVGFSGKAVRQFEEFQLSQADTSDALSANVERTQTLKDASFVTLSPNDELPNERVLKLGEGLSFALAEGEVRLDTTGLVKAEGGHPIRFVAEGETEVVVPLIGFLVTREAEEELANKTLRAPSLSDLTDALDDAAAGAAGVPIGGVYRNGSALMIRAT